MDAERAGMRGHTPDKRLAVLHLAPGRAYGGVETLLRTMHVERAHAPALRQQFALVYPGKLEHELRALNAEVHVLGPARAARPLGVLRARQSLAALITQCGVDVVVCHGAWVQALFGAGLRERGIVVAAWLHSVPRKRSWEERLARCCRPDLVFYNSRHTGLRCHDDYAGVPSRVLYPPLAKPTASPFGQRERTRRDLGAAADDVVIALVGRFDPAKGQDVLVEALAQLRGVRPLVWLVGGAQGPRQLAYLHALQARVAALGLGEQVRFLGERGDVSALLGAADIYCQPNVQSEGFGLAFVEALAAGLPVVTTRLGGALEIVDDRCGELVRPGPHSLATALESLITDAQRRARLASAAAARATELCDPAARLAEFERTLLDVALNSPGSAPRRRSAPTISVVVPSIGRPAYLELCLRALAAQTLPPLEIVVGVRDHHAATARVIRELAPSLGVTLRSAPTSRSGQVASMTGALALCRGELVAITDDDAEPFPDWLERLADCFDDPRVGAAGGRDLQALETGSRTDVGRVQWFGRVIGQHHIGVGPPRPVDFLKGVNACFRAHLLRQGGFEPRTAGPGVQLGWELATCLPLRREGWLILYDPAIRVRHHIAPRRPEDPDQLHRGQFTPRPHADAVHNETLALLEYGTRFSRTVFMAYSVLVGTSGEPGLLQVPRLLARRQPAVFSRFFATLDGRRRGLARYLADRVQRGSPA
jgi:glycosyltransferase involved in cell wall biosynthesis/GT2 family glycosyltransferase